MRILLLSLLLVACSSTPVAPPPAAPGVASDASWSQTPVRPAEYTGMERRSHYVTMRDGVRLAVDVWLPTGLKAGTKLPTILEQTRYYRSSIIKADPNGACRPAGKATLNMLVTHGYAYVVVDTRGSGASFGTRSAEYSPAEIKDGAQIVDWIVRQDWSDGRVGAQGQSYTGTTAEMLLRNHHPAVKAVSPTFSGYDFYTEILFPGGIRSTFAQVLVRSHQRAGSRIDERSLAGAGSLPGRRRHRSLAAARGDCAARRESQRRRAGAASALHR